MADEQPDPRHQKLLEVLYANGADELVTTVELIAAADAVDPARAALRSIAAIAGASESATARLADIRQVLKDAGVTT